MTRLLTQNSFNRYLTNIFSLTWLKKYQNIWEHNSRRFIGNQSLNMRLYRNLSVDSEKQTISLLININYLFADYTYS